MESRAWLSEGAQGGLRPAAPDGQGPSPTGISPLRILNCRNGRVLVRAGSSRRTIARETRPLLSRVTMIEHAVREAVESPTPGDEECRRRRRECGRA